MPFVPIKFKPVLRYLRIGWTVFFGVLCLLLIGLSVRSYWWLDVVYYPASRPIIANSVNGALQLNVLQSVSSSGWGPQWGWKVYRIDAIGQLSNKPAWSWRIGNGGTTVSVIGCPIWFATTVAVLFASAPWLLFWSRWRFSLRTLLIFTTLVAVVLGVIVWAVRK